jgi:hypothetical protein
VADSETSICNSALAKVGAERILSLDDSSPNAQLCKEQYPKVRDELLRSHPWNFTITRIALAATGTAPVFGFEYQYTIPRDCMRILEIDSNELDWQKEGQYIVTDSDTLSIKYIAKVTEVGKFDANFSEVLALKLAHDISYGITQSTALKKQLHDDFEERLRTARSFDGQEGSSNRVYAREWRNSRN